MKRIFFSAVFCFILALNLFAQENLLRQLLDLPSPPPVSLPDDSDEINEKPKRPEEFYDKKNVPPENAPIADLIDFWKRQNFITAGHPNKIEPDEKTLKRLIKSVEVRPENLKDLLTLLPVNEEVGEVIKKAFDAQGQYFDDDWREKIGTWLKYNSKYDSDDLYAAARNAKDHKTYGYVIKDKELRALAKVDWEKGESLLESLENDTTNPRTAFLAKRLIYEHALKEKDTSKIEKYFSEFQKIVKDKTASGRMRDDALESLIQNEAWQGSDEWYLSLFEDETLLELNIDERATSNPLDGIAYKDPDKWIPIMTKLIGNKNSNIHNAAAQALVQFQLNSARKDALLPLLPWLTNPEWAKDTGMSRHRLIQSIDDVDMPESILSLIWIVENDETYADWAADSLAKYKDVRAIPAIKAALFKSKDEEERKRFLNGLIASGGLSNEEQIIALESYAEKISTPEGYKQIEETYFFNEETIPPVQISIGKYLANQSHPNDGLILRAIEREKNLRKEKTEVAKTLSVIMQKWQGRLIDLEMLRKISDGNADVETVLGALARRKELKERVLNDIYAMHGKSRLASGISACLLEDENQILNAFRSRDLETQISILACARLIRAKLPVFEVGRFLNSQNKLLALAAERYLESEDSAEARGLVWAKHPGEALILGARDSFNPAKYSSSSFDSPLQQLFNSVDGSYFSGYAEGFDKAENELRKEVLENANLGEIFRFGAHSVRVFADKTVYRWDLDDARYRERILKKEEFESFRRAVVEQNIYNRPPVRGYCHHNCASGEFIILNRNGGLRLYMYAAYSQVMPYNLLFTKLQNKDAKLVYRLSEKLKGLEVLLTDKNFSPKAIWKNGDDFRILVEDEVKKAEIEKSVEKLNDADNKNEELDYTEKETRRFERKTEREFEHFEWRRFEKGKLQATISEPAEIPFLRYGLSFPAIKNLSSNENIGQAIIENYEIRAGGYDKGGLWKVNRAQQFEFKQGKYSSPIVSGNWVVAAKAERDWSAPNYVYRINLQNGKEIKVNVPPAETFNPVTFVAARNKILLYRDTEPDSTKSAEYFLLDANTGKSKLVTGEFRPLLQQTFRALQSTGKANEFWAAVDNKSKNQTEIGRYNAKDFSFKTVLAIPEIQLDSMNIWVDEGEAKVYFIYKGNYYGESHLLSLPLPKGK